MLTFQLMSGRIERGTAESAGFDVFYDGVESIFVGDSVMKVPTGVRSIMSPGLVAIMKEKSGLSAKGIEVKAGVIDSDYRDEWFVMLRNPIRASPTSIYGPVNVIVDSGWTPFEIKPGMKIAQFIVMELPKVGFVASEGASLTLKGDVRSGGYGSTGAF